MRANRKKDFEGVYLRASRFKGHIDAELHGFLNMPDTKKVIGYMTNKSYSKYYHIMQITATTQEDLKSIMSVYALYYLHTNRGTPVDYKKMMQSMGQRVSFLIKSHHRKGGLIGEKMEEVILSEDGVQMLESMKTYSPNTEQLMDIARDEEEQEDELRLQKEILDEDPFKYAKTLQKLASIETKDRELREEARKFCKTHGIILNERKKKSKAKNVRLK